MESVQNHWRQKHRKTRERERRWRADRAPAKGGGIRLPTSPLRPNRARCPRNRAVFRPRAFCTSAAAAGYQRLPGQPESALPHCPKRIWPRNGGKGMKTKSSPVPIPLPPFLGQKFAALRQWPRRHPAALCQCPASAYRGRWPHTAPLRRSGSPHGGGYRSVVHILDRH